MALINKLSAIGDAIREKTGKEDLLTLDQMPEEIKGISGGGGEIVDAIPVILTGDANKAFYKEIGTNYINILGSTITTKELTNTASMFAYNKAKRIPFEINYKLSHSSAVNATETFAYSGLEYLPKLTNEENIGLNNRINMGGFCRSTLCLKEIPKNFFEEWGGEEYWNYQKTQQGNRASMFDTCVSLRSLPDLYPLASTTTSIYNTLYYMTCNNCYVLDELALPVIDIAFTSNAFYSTVGTCSRLKKIIFETENDGSPKTISTWKSNQTLTLSNIGFAYYDYYITNYTSYHGIGEEKRITDDTTYQTLKDDPDCWTTLPEYSRYNHDSAVETINTLPDVSSTGYTHTIKFLGNAGSKTDGGAINTLTEEEIAVATDKGWTISIS